MAFNGEIICEKVIISFLGFGAKSKLGGSIKSKESVRAGKYCRNQCKDCFSRQNSFDCKEQRLLTLKQENWILYKDLNMFHGIQEEDTERCLTS